MERLLGRLELRACRLGAGYEHLGRIAPSIFRGAENTPRHRNSWPLAEAGGDLTSQAIAMHSISISNSIGHDDMATKVRAGGLSGK